jgi:Cu(I)/Ag(I) efflux system membrane fusion protein
MRHVAIGDYVKEGAALFKVIDLTKVWVMFDAYESDLPWINIGDQVDFTVQSIPGKTYEAKVTYIDLLIDAQTRVAKVRVEVANPRLTLKPEMFTVGLLESKIAEGSNEIIVPKSSILWTGKRAVVYVKVPNRESPSFLYREVVLGPEAGAFYVISEGLQEGEEIAVNGVFKIDAASQLQGLPSMMNPEGGKVSTGHDHGGTPMSDEEMENMDSGQTSEAKAPTETPIKFKMQFGKVVDSYLLLKDALVESDENQAESAAQKTLEILNGVDMTLLKGDAHNQWMKLQNLVKDNLNGLIQIKGLEMKRSHFSNISNDLTNAIEAFGFESDKPAYLVFCPMAFDDKGAYWISNEKEIRNPYFGDMMLKCGEVKKTIN